MKKNILAATLILASLSFSAPAFADEPSPSLISEATVSTTVDEQPSATLYDSAPSDSQVDDSPTPITIPPIVIDKDGYVVGYPCDTTSGSNLNPDANASAPADGSVSVEASNGDVVSPIPVDGGVVPPVDENASDMPSVNYGDGDVRCPEARMFDMAAGPQVDVDKVVESKHSGIISPYTIPLGIIVVALGGLFFYTRAKNRRMVEPLNPESKEVKEESKEASKDDFEYSAEEPKAEEVKPEVKPAAKKKAPVKKAKPEEDK
jgi:hypothetical protein